MNKLMEYFPSNRLKSIIFVYMIYFVRILFQYKDGNTEKHYKGNFK